MGKRKEFEANIDIDEPMREIEAICLMKDRDIEEGLDEEQRMTTKSCDAPDDDDVSSSSVSAVKRRNHVMSKDLYCDLMRKTNAEQRELILEIIHRLQSGAS